MVSLFRNLAARRKKLAADQATNSFRDLRVRLEEAEQAEGGYSKKMQNEGRSHDVADNKGPISLTRDINENKRLISYKPPYHENK